MTDVLDQLQAAWRRSDALFDLLEEGAFAERPIALRQPFIFYVGHLPVGSRPEGVSAWGVHELVGNGWEHTSTIFRPLPGFEAWVPGYPGYSANFFDDQHTVVFGGSWATSAVLLRRSFRNWFQMHYRFVFGKFRRAW